MHVSWTRHKSGGKRGLIGVAGETSWRPHVPLDAGPHRTWLFREVPVSDSSGRFTREYGHRRREFAGGEQRVARRPIRTKSLSTVSCVPRAPQGQHLPKGPDIGPIHCRGRRIGDICGQSGRHAYGGTRCLV